MLLTLLSTQLIPAWQPAAAAGAAGAAQAGGGPLLAWPARHALRQAVALRDQPRAVLRRGGWVRGDDLCSAAE